MPHPQASLVTAIDMGSSKTCVLVAEVAENGLQYRGHGVTESRGTRKGAIVDLEKAIAGIQRACELAEEAAGASVERALVGVSGVHIRGINSRAGVSVATRAREITREDVRQAVEKARAVVLPDDREVLHLLPQEFLLDEQNSIRDPLGMLGSRLEAKVHMVTAAAAATQTVVSAVNRAGVQVDDTVYEALASADAILRPDERELGVCLADIGAGSTDLIVYHEGSVVHTAVIPIGGDHFTNDVAVGLRTPLGDAEKIKCASGSAQVSRVPEGNEIEVPSVGDRPSRLMPQRSLAEILEPRAQELFEMLRDNLAHSGVLELCGAGLVLTGGGSRLRGMAQVAEEVLKRPVRSAVPAVLDKMPATLAEPEFSTALGMIFYGHRAVVARGAQPESLLGRLKAMFVKNGTNGNGTNGHGR
ncbi:MAG TPA: cell division protein FtsA [Terriglobales bacterium]|nr:cell division protein FtsA [Terriglobales bacterium]